MTVQAVRIGTPRDVLYDADRSARINRIRHGAHRMAGIGSAYTGEVAVQWELTAPAKYTYERMRPEEGDGVVIVGATSSAILGIWDLHMGPVLGLHAR